MNDYTCQDCRFHSDVRGYAYFSFDGKIRKIIPPSRAGHCVLYEINLSDINICRNFKRR